MTSETIVCLQAFLYSVKQFIALYIAALVSELQNVYLVDHNSRHFDISWNCGNPFKK